jgi:hypothetical protein
MKHIERAPVVRMCVGLLRRGYTDPTIVGTDREFGP